MEIFVEKRELNHQHKHWSAMISWELSKVCLEPPGPTFDQLLTIRPEVLTSSSCRHEGLYLKAVEWFQFAILSFKIVCIKRK